MLLKQITWRLLAVVCLFSSTLSIAGNVITVEKAWVREAPPVSRVNAAYMIIRNNSAKDVTLESVVSRFYAEAMIHRTVIENGISRMLHQDKLVIPAHGHITLQPDGLHMMLMQPISPLREGDSIFVKLNFAELAPVFVNLPVQKTAP